MGFEYLGGKRWAQVTRDERFFCQRLYELVNEETPESFARHISEILDLDLPARGEWEIGFEVCFYRDLWQLQNREGKPLSHKRTFDLCLFGEDAIVIIEAKAAVDFEREQNAEFEKDIAEVQRLTGIHNVQLIALCSSRCKVDPDLTATFQNKILRWSDLAARYRDDEILSRADSVYEAQSAFATWGRHSDTMLTGNDLLEAFQSGKRCWVGRGGGLNGSRFAEDVRTGGWKRQKYEVNSEAALAPSQNYFGLDDFVGAVGGEINPGAVPSYPTSR